MIELVLVRHGITDWNAARRLQGQRDIPLNDEGRALVDAWRFSPPYDAVDLSVSPLVRCRETADIIKSNNPGLGDITYDDRLLERDMGIWAGRDLRAVETEFGDAAHDGGYRPEGGESRRDMLVRTRDFIAATATGGRPRLVVTHRGVIRAFYAIATGWDLTGETADELSRRRAQVFRAAADGSVEVAQLNLRLTAPTAN
ncbi:MAG: phosphoglycerate mutase [Alphaproteobacteria bacterium]|nr:phosphoglycerate mutase [Alphaproteobacteria bacterium]